MVRNKSLEDLIVTAKRFATHSLRRGRTNSMRAAGVLLSYIEERGQWALDCGHKYIKPTVGDKLKWDVHYVR